MSAKLNMSLAELDNRSYHYSDGDPTGPKWTVLISTTQAAVKARNVRNGPNATFLARMLIVAVYQLWEDEYRGLIAAERSVDKNSVTSDLFGDLRRYRQSIIHNGSVAIAEVKRNKVLHWFAPGESVSPTTLHMNALLPLLHDDIRRFNN